MEVDALSAEVAQLEKELAELEQQLAEAKAEESDLHHREATATRILSMQDINPEEELKRAQGKLFVVLHRLTEAEEV